jgi:hypothetical protein
MGATLMDFGRILHMPFVGEAVSYTAQVTLRYVILEMIKPVKPGDLLIAIQNDVSLWSMHGDRIKDAKEAKLPDYIVDNSDKFIQMINANYGGFTELTMVWLREDKPILASIILNTPGGLEWLNKNVHEILDGCGINANRS